ncbi:MAG: ABC transporter permease [Candidatus Heimdallarchaeota archaeon]|nr:ABC transporter permease [Candidatus Heimdallarchaeota archaeon]
MSYILSKNYFLRLYRQLRGTWKVFSRNKFGVTGLIILSVLLLLAILGPQLTKYDAYEFNKQDRFQSPNEKHRLGTNIDGQDMLAVLLESLVISLQIGIIAGSVTVIIGTTIGTIGAYLGGKADALILRLTEIVIVMPPLPLMLLLSTLNTVVYGKPMSWQIIALIYIVVFWPVSARLIRGRVLSLREQTFITATVAAGGRDRYIIFRHLLPNVFPLMLTMIITSIRQAIIYEAFLSFLGLGDPLKWTLGLMLRRAQDQAAFATGAWWLIYPPAIAIALVTLSFAFIGIAFDEIVDPRLRKR